MKPLLKIKPLRFNFLASFSLFMMAIFVGVQLILDVVLFRNFSSLTQIIEPININFFIGILLSWLFEEITKFERWAVIVTKRDIQVPEGFFDKKTFLLGELDKKRTLTYNSQNKIQNRVNYTLWSTNGGFVVIRKVLYGKSQINSLLETIGLSKV
jgi:hypothetical protein